MAWRGSAALVTNLLGAFHAADGRAVSSASTFSTILLHETLRKTAQPKRERVLDVGCGTSPYRDFFPADLYVGLDWSGGAQQGRPLIVGDATQLPIGWRLFDGIVCTEAIEHVVDDRALALELARVARPGATLVLSSPFVHGLHEQPHDFRRLTSIGLVSVLDQAGWTVEEMRSVGGPMVVAVDSLIRWFDPLFRRIARRLGGPAGAPFRMVDSCSRSAQRLAALAALTVPGGGMRSIDPFAPDPRLTLGYVVTAVLNEEQHWARGR